MAKKIYVKPDAEYISFYSEEEIMSVQNIADYANETGDGNVDAGNASGGLEIATGGFGLPDNAVENWKNYLKQQAAAGTPVQILYMLEQPEIIELTPVEITAISGLNTLTCEAGECEVTYRADPRKLLENLA